MIGEVEMREHLERFLKARDVPVARLSQHVEDVFGAPRMVTAAGSVIHGFGNPGSDIDVLALVDNPRVTTFPLASYDGELAFDVTYLDTAWARDVGEKVTGGTLLSRVHEPDGCAETHDTLVQFTRLPLGVLLEAEPAWGAWVSRMRGPALAGVLRRWWVLRALRSWAAARIVRGARPRLAAHRYCDAGMALLNARATAAGECYFGPKWVAVKLTRLADNEGLAVYDRLLGLPAAESDLPSFMDNAERLLGALADHDPEDVTLVASYAPGVKLWRANGRTLVSRWMMRGLEFGEPLPRDGDGPIWRGCFGDLPPWLHELLLHDMAWLGIVDWGGHEDSRG